MKIRPSIILLVGIIVLLIALIVWFGKRKSESTITANLDANSISPQIPRTNGVRASAKPSFNNSSLPPAKVTNAATSILPTIVQSNDAKQGLAGLNDVPIIFYGSLEDQFGNPVVGAQIAADVRIYNGSQSTVDRFSVTSDSNGGFFINHGKGETLWLNPKKNGYFLVASNVMFKYSYMYQDHYSPDANNPTVIKMWKLQGAEPLVGISQNYKIPFTSEPICFDLIQRKIVPSGGDIKIQVNRPSGIISQQHPQNWGIALEVVDGGLIQVSDTEWGVTCFAPEGDYQSHGVFSNDNGSDMTIRSFFIRSRNGQVYSKLGLSFRINNTPDRIMYLSFSGVANTNGSRNWEASMPK